jgi:hypothetical protein
LSKTPVTQVIDWYLCYRNASGSGGPSLGPKGSSTASTPKPKDCWTTNEMATRTIYIAAKPAVYYLCIVPSQIPWISCTPHIDSVLVSPVYSLVVVRYIYCVTFRIFFYFVIFSKYFLNYLLNCIVG